MEFLFAFIICLITLFILKGYIYRTRLHEICDKLPGIKRKSVIYYLYLLRYTYFNKKNVKPTTIMLEMVSAIHQVFNKEGIACIWIAFRPFVFFFHPDSVQDLLSNHTTIDKSREYIMLHPWLGTGLLTSTGDKWRSRRKLLTPTLHFRILEDFMPIFNEQSLVLVNKMLEGGKQKSFIDITPIMTMCTLDIICETAMGVKMRAQSGCCGDYVKALLEVQETLLYRMPRPWLWLNKVFYCFPSGWRFLRNIDLLHQFTRKVIKEKKELLLKQKNKSDPSDSFLVRRRKVFLELLLEHHFEDKLFTEEDIREEVDTFMFEGHDTTAMGLSFVLYNVGLLPEVQENIILEIDSIFGEDTERPVTTDDLRLMKYTECVIKESLRLYPSVPALARELTDDLKVLDYTIAPGSLCLICPYILHRNPEVFPNPEKFDPERFFPENASGRHPYAYIPFSAGPRNCIGQKFALMEEKTVLANIFRHVRVQSLDVRDKVHVTPDLILRNSEPLRLKITSRKGENER